MSDNLRSMRAQAWMDSDGQHIIFAHDHGLGVIITTMLPWPTWRAVDGRVEPSIVCDCGIHCVGLRVEVPNE